jgi:hypothetical protein
MKNEAFFTFYLLESFCRNSKNVTVETMSSYSIKFSMIYPSIHYIRVYLIATTFYMEYFIPDKHTYSKERNGNSYSFEYKM